MFTPFDNAKNSLNKVKQDWTNDFVESAPYCKNCGTTLSEFLNSGFVGCAFCYEAFSAYLKDFAIEVHGRGVHTGKLPSKEATKTMKKREIAKLYEMENKAVSDRDYILANQIKNRREKLMGEL